MAAFCDLHTHSCYSDGSNTPLQLIQEAQSIGLAAIVLCDHNTVAGLPLFLQAAEGSTVEAVPGIEFSTEYKGIELHMLGLFLEPRYYSEITDMMEDYHCRKDESNINLVNALRTAGYMISYDAIKAKTPNGQVNRAHIAAALAQSGYTATVKEAFSRLLHPQRGFYTPPKRLDVFEAIRYIKSIGATAVLAHPFLNLDAEELRSFLPQAVPCGLDGMEVAYSQYDSQTTLQAMRLAEEFGILPSGGSDFHGKNKPDISLGTGRGDLAVPVQWLEALRSRKK